MWVSPLVVAVVQFVVLVTLSLRGQAWSLPDEQFPQDANDVFLLLTRMRALVLTVLCLCATLLWCGSDELGFRYWIWSVMAWVVVALWHKKQASAAH